MRSQKPNSTFTVNTPPPPYKLLIFRFSKGYFQRWASLKNNINAKSHNVKKNSRKKALKDENTF